MLEKVLDYGKLISEAWKDEAGNITLLSKIQDIPSAKLQKLNDERVKSLGELVKRVERHLVEIGSALDNIGNGGAGRILYVINRSKLHMEEFEKLWPTLEIGDIDGWINYGQFVHRGVLPAFRLIKSTGERLVSLRGRLQNITEMIQTSALIIETEATRSNTEILRRISSNIYLVGVPLAFIFSAIVVSNKITSFAVENSIRMLLAVAAPVLATIFYRVKKHENKKETEADQAAWRLDLHQLLRGPRRNREDRQG
jgi:hypothetical protein